MSRPVDAEKPFRKPVLKLSKYIVSLVVPGFIASGYFVCSSDALARPNCSVALYIQAEETIISARARWDSLYRHQQMYGACDDGGLAEGYSDAVAQLLAWQWGQIKDLAEVSDSDPGFRRWMIKHIDATASTQDLRKMMHNSDKCIGDGENRLCKLIRTAAEEAISAQNSNTVKHRSGDRLPNRDGREITMAENAIFWALVASSGERNRNECARNSFACSDDRADLGLALLGSKLSIEANDALIALLRYRLDGGVASNFTCFVLSKKSIARETLARIMPSALRERCVGERERTIRSLPELMSDVDRNAICADTEEIEAKRRQLLAGLKKGETCPSSDF